MTDFLLHFTPKDHSQVDYVMAKSQTMHCPIYAKRATGAPLLYGPSLLLLLAACSGGGGAGTDTLSYAGSNSGVTINLLTGSGTGGHAEGDVLSNIENITGSDHGDVLTGASGANVINGGRGHDTIIGGAGADTIDGGADRDMLSYVGSDAGVTIDLSMGSASGGHATGDSFSNIEHVTGSDHNDVLTGSSGSNTINGEDGNDTLSGGSGNDTINGGDGADIITGGSGNDKLNGGDGADNITGGDGNDTMTGGAGNDRFVIFTEEQTENLTLENLLSYGRDRITDFTVGDKLLIDLADDTTITDVDGFFRETIVNPFNVFGNEPQILLLLQVDGRNETILTIEGINYDFVDITVDSIFEIV